MTNSNRMVDVKNIICPNSIVSKIKSITGGKKNSIPRYYPKPKIEKPKKW